MTHTTVYTDFDGVINAINDMPPTARSGWNGEWTKKRINGYSITWSHNLVEFYRHLDARDDVTVKVLSTWTTEWTTMLAPELGVGHHWPIVGADVPEEAYEDFATWWKLEALQKDIDENPPGKMVWIDDDFIYEPRALASLQGLAFDHVAVTPQADLGLTRYQAEGILRFIDHR